jgi:hypothetical protein
MDTIGLYATYSITIRFSWIYIMVIVDLGLFKIAM